MAEIEPEPAPEAAVDLPRRPTWDQTYRVMLDYQSNEIRLDDRGFSLLIRLVQRYRICDRCYRSFTTQNPNVCANSCLECFMGDAGRRHSLTYQGIWIPEQKEPVSHRWLWEEQLRAQHWFLDSEGFVHISHAGPGYHDRDSCRDIPATLQHWGFPLPETAEKNGQPVTLNPGRFYSFFGDLKQDSVLVLHYSHRYEGTEFYFLSQRNGKAMQINRRKPSHRRALEEIRRTLPPGATEWDMYRHLARRLSQELAPVQQPELLEEPAPRGTDGEP